MEKVKIIQLPKILDPRGNLNFLESTEFNENDFYGADHLNISGSKKL